MLTVSIFKENIDKYDNRYDTSIKMEYIITKYKKEEVISKMRKPSFYIDFVNNGILFNICGHKNILNPLIIKFNELKMEPLIGDELIKNEYKNIKVEDDQIYALFQKKYPELKKDEIYKQFKVKHNKKIIFGIEEKISQIPIGIISINVFIKKDKFDFAVSNLESLLDLVCEKIKK